MSAATTKAIVISAVLHSAGIAALCANWSAPRAAGLMTISALFLIDGDAQTPNLLPAIVAEPIHEPTFPWPTIAPVTHQAEVTSPRVVEQPEPTSWPSTEPITNAITTPSVQPNATRNPNVVNTNHDPSAVSFCGVTAQATSVVFVIDCSASMGLHGRLQRALQEVESSLRQLPATTRFQIIAYHRAAEPLRMESKSGLLSAQPSTIAAALLYLHQRRAEGSADHRRAINAALAMKPDVIYFLTDEDDFTAAAAFDLTRANAGRTSIHAICLVAPTLIQSPLAQLASHNRGTFTVLDH